MTAAALTERSLLATLCAAALAALLVVARNGLAPTQSPWTFGLVLWASFTALYLLALAPVALVAVLGRLVARRHPALERALPWLLAAAGLGFLAVVLGWNPRAVQPLTRLPGPPLAAWSGLLAAVAAVVGIAASAAAPEKLRLVRRAATALALAATATAFVSRPDPRVVAEKRELPGVLTRQRLLVVGIDGAAWPFIDQLVARGEMPVMAALRERAAWGPLATIRPTASPVIWTTIFTGLKPEKHGIDGFTKKRLLGVDEPWPELRNVRGTGLRVVEASLAAGELIVDMPASSDQRRVPALWNVASAYASPMDVVEVWATWPAEPILGNLATDRLHFFPARPGEPLQRPPAATHPPALYDEVAPLIPRAGEIPVAVAQRFMDVSPAELEAIRHRPGEGWDVTRQFDDFVVTFETSRRVALHLMEKSRAVRGAPDDMVVYFRMVDQFSHTSLGCSELVAVPDCEPADRPRFKGVVSEAYRATDKALGELVDAFGPGNVIVVSDHGWQRQDRHDRPGYGHHAAPEGIFLAAGPAFRPGRVDGLTVFDMMPLFLRLKGFALARDLEGRVPEQVLAPEFLAATEAASIDSYGRREKLPPAAVTGGHDEEVKERLRALGYIE
jgi:hypothetical protein